MTVERSHITHETRYELRERGAQRCVLAFDTGTDGKGPAVWKILLPGPTGTEDVYGTQEFARPNAAQLTAWLAPIVGQDAATELAAAVDADPPHATDWQHSTDG